MSGYQELAKILQLARKNVPPGVWIHISSGKRYHVYSSKVLEERTCKPMVVYSPLGQWANVLWVRPVDEFLQRFKKIQ